MKRFLIAVLATLVAVSATAQNRNGLVMPSVDPKADSIFCSCAFLGFDTPCI